MPSKRKSWTEKLLDNKDFPRVEKITGKMSKRLGTGTVVIPKPIEVDELMREVPKGKLTTINHIRKVLAQKHNANIRCPLTSGMFARIAAEVAQEKKERVEKNITPYWFTLKTGGTINPKYPDGSETQKKLLESEGHKAIQKGKKYVVIDYEKALVKF